MNKTVSLSFAILFLATGCGLKITADSPNQHISSLEVSQDIPRARSLDKQADALFLSGSYAQSVRYYRQALALRESVLGNLDLAVIQSLYNLATVHEEKGEYVDAIKLYKRALNIAQKHSSLYANTIQGFIAVLFEARGIIGKSKNSTLQSVSAYKNFTKGKHPFYGIVLYKLARFYSQEDNVKQANRYFQASITTIEQNIGKQHPYLAVILEDYARFSRNKNLDTDSAYLEERAAKIRAYYPKKQHCEIYNQEKQSIL